MIEWFELRMKNTGNEPMCRRIFTTEHEYIMCSGMSMNIDADKWRSLISDQVCKKCFCMKHSRMLDWTRVFVLPIEVDASHAASLVAAHNSIWINHWYDVEDKLFPDRDGCRMVGQEDLQSSVHDMRTVCFSGVNSRRQKNHRLLAGIRHSVCFVRYCEQVAFVSKNAVAHLPCLTNVSCTLHKE